MIYWFYRLLPWPVREIIGSPPSLLLLVSGTVPNLLQPLPAIHGHQGHNKGRQEQANTIYHSIGRSSQAIRATKAAGHRTNDSTITRACVGRASRPGHDLMTCVTSDTKKAITPIAIIKYDKILHNQTCIHFLTSFCRVPAVNYFVFFSHMSLWLFRGYVLWGLVGFYCWERIYPI